MVNKDLLSDGHYKEVEDWDELDRLIEDYLQEVINNRGVK